MFWHSLQLEQRIVSIQGSSDGGRAASAATSAGAAGAAAARLQRQPRPVRRGRAACGRGLLQRVDLLPLLFLPRRLLARQRLLGVRVVDAAVLLQPVPEQHAAPRRLHRRESTITRCSRFASSTASTNGTRSAASFSGQRQPVRDRHHRGGPAVARHHGEVMRVASVAQHEVGVGEADPFLHTLQVVVGVCEFLDWPVFLGIAVVLEGEARGPVGAGVRVVGECRERTRLHRRRGGQVRREVARFGRRSGEQAEQRWPAAAHAAAHAVAQGIEVRDRGLKDEHAAEPHGRRRQPRAADAEREVALADRGFLQQVGVLHQHLHRHAGRQHFHQHRIFRRIVALRRNADEIVGELREVVGRQRMLVEAFEERVVVGLDIAAARLRGRQWRPPSPPRPASAGACGAPRSPSRSR